MILTSSFTTLAIPQPSSSLYKTTHDVTQAIRHLGRELYLRGGTILEAADLAAMRDMAFTAQMDNGSGGTFGLNADKIDDCVQALQGLTEHMTRDETELLEKITKSLAQIEAMSLTTL